MQFPEGLENTHFTKLAFYYSFEPKSAFLWKNCQIALLSIGFSGRNADLFWAKTVDYTAADHL